MTRKKQEKKVRRAKRWAFRISFWMVIFAAAAGLLTAESLTWPGRLNVYLRGNIDTNGYCMELDSTSFNAEDYKKEFNLEEANLWFKNWDGNNTGKDLKEIASETVGKALYEYANGRNEFATEFTYSEYCNEEMFERYKTVINVDMNSKNYEHVNTLDDYVNHEMKKYLVDRNIEYNYYQTINKLQIPEFIYRLTTDFPEFFRSTDRINACEYETFLQCFAKAQEITIDEYDIKRCARELYICEKEDDVMITMKPENGWSKRHAFTALDMYLNKDYCRYFTLRWKAEQELKKFTAEE